MAIYQVTGTITIDVTFGVEAFTSLDARKAGEAIMDKFCAGLDADDFNEVDPEEDDLTYMVDVSYVEEMEEEDDEEEAEAQ